jgi:hypothetical protein
MNNLAEAYRAQWNLNMAIELHSKVLEARKQILGVDHPDTLLSINNLATAHFDK